MINQHCCDLSEYFDFLDNTTFVRSYPNTIKSKSGIYSMINKVNGIQYIASATDLYIRLLEHIAGKKSNSALQTAIGKYGLNNFSFVVVEYVANDNKSLNNKKITDLDTTYTAKFDFSKLYNHKLISTSMLGYKHTQQALLKMVERFKVKKNHPMFGKTHTNQARKLIWRKKSYV